MTPFYGEPNGKAIDKMSEAEMLTEIERLMNSPAFDDILSSAIIETPAFLQNEEGVAFEFVDLSDFFEEPNKPSCLDHVERQDGNVLYVKF